MPIGDWSILKNKVDHPDYLIKIYVKTKYETSIMCISSSNCR